MAFTGSAQVNVNDATDLKGTTVEETYKEDGSVQAAKHVQPLESLVLDGYTYTFAKGGEKASEPAYYWATSTNTKQQATIRLYNTNTMTITAPAGKTFKSIAFKGTNGTANKEVGASVGSASMPSKTEVNWSSDNEVSSVTLTFNCSYRIETVTISADASSQEPSTETKCANPYFSQYGGEVEKGFVLTMTCSTEGASMFYTTDGTDPYPGGKEYTAAGIVINESCTVKVIAVKEGLENSDVRSANFTVKEASEEPTTGTVYVPTTTLATGKYIFVYDGKYAAPYSGTQNYGRWDLKSPISVDGDEMTVSADNEFTLTVSAEGVTIQDNTGRYYGMDATHGTSFQFYTEANEGCYWASEFVEGKIQLTNKLNTEGIIGHSGTYTNMAPAVKHGDDFVLPTLYVAKDAAGVNDIAADEAEGVAEYYNLQGVKVVNPAAGNLYIVKKGNKVSKMLVK